jgi:hypothetical protein
MMNLEKRALFTIISLLTLFSLGTFAQSKKESIKPSETKQKVEEVKSFSSKYSQTCKILWTAPSTNNSEGISQSFLNFDGVSLSGTEGMPYYSAKAKLPSGYKNGKVSLINLAFEELSASELAIASKYNKIANVIEVNTSLVYTKKIPSLAYDFIPLRKNPSSGKIEKLVAFDINISPLENTRSAGRSHVFASESVLKTGTWFKVGIVKDGVYKIDFNYLKTLGAKTEEIDPRNIKIYGTGGQQLPFLNSTERFDDLTECAIYCEGESDGVLNESDFALFYGKAPHRWMPDNSCLGMMHRLNDYTDTSYYFINIDGNPGKRINQQSSVAQNATSVVNSFDDFAFYENEAVNVVKSGRQWFGENFDVVTTYNFPFNFPNIDVNAPAYIKTQVAARSNPAATFNVNCASTNLVISPAQVALQPYYADPVTIGSGCQEFVPNASQLNVEVKFTKSPTFNSGYGYLDFIELRVRRQLKMAGNEVAFRDFVSAGVGQIADFNIADASINTIVWDISDFNNVKQIQGVLNGNLFSFRANADTVFEYIAFNSGSNAIKEPFSFGSVENQNLHGLGFYDMIIVSHPLFIEQSQRLADLHFANDGLKSLVVTPQTIYNEFSGGNQDVTAIKQFLMMFYNRAVTEAEMPKYLLLMGDASFKNRGRSIVGNTNFVVSYESANGISYINSYVSDDYFGLLDESEGEGLTEQIDVAVGRIPVKSKEEAKAVVDKIYAYLQPQSIDVANPSYCGTAGSVSNGDWRNVICFVADDEDNNLHFAQSERLAAYVDTTYHDYNIDKIYIDAFKQQSAAGGARYPDVNTAINQRVDRGALIVNYTGHGGETGWSQERILEVKDIESWNNANRLPLFVTATCEFSRFDDPARTSAGEEVILRPNGGGIGLLTTTRLAYANFNETLNRNFYQNVFVRDSITKLYPRVGDVCTVTKNKTASVSSGTSNHRNFSLLCDPAVRLNFPDYKAYTQTINNQPVTLLGDTMNSLSKITITGYIANLSGTKLTSYNGIIFPTVFDKETKLKTLANDPQLSSTQNFKMRKSIIYRGKASVINGEFSFSFVVPKDIDYAFGIGRISYYAADGVNDANGYNESFVVGGINPNAPTDGDGPKIDLFMNDNKFVAGSITNENPDLLGVLFDDNGINTVGNGIGHDLVAVLDENTEKSIVLNDYYQSDLNSYQSGIVRYPFSKLSDGRHTLTLRAWDVYNNSNTANTDFVVTTSANLALEHVLNYPNPFTTYTKFMFEHNKPCETLDVSIQIFTVSGRLVKTLESLVKCEGFRSEQIAWDGLDDFGDRIGRGVYVYRLKVSAQDGTWADKYEKLVVLK